MKLMTVVVPTKNSSATLGACLDTIKNQTYKHIELIVVDNSSTDDTKEMAKQYTKHVFNKGPERTAQRNYAATKATGELIMFIDSDMELAPEVVEQCVAEYKKDASIGGVVIHEESFGEGFWAQCKRLERSFYVGVPWIEGARCFTTELFHKLKGYDEALVSGEDWDLSKRAEKHGKIIAIDAFIRHNEGRISLWKTLKKKYYYAQFAAAYLKANPVDSMMTAEAGPINRYKLFFSKPKVLFGRPHIGVAMLLMKTAEFGAGAIGYIKAWTK
ncbi:glycosyltransferase family 2 protein [Candidatus Saccharibacteria bacterium]|nr:glycosyltransferase family 2 protein [Candidatus Saccharibacteria bacterium]